MTEPVDQGRTENLVLDDFFPAGERKIGGDDCGLIPGSRRYHSYYKWWNNGNYNQLTKYYDGDNRVTLEPEDDAATVILGDEWQTPSTFAWAELFNNCNTEWTTINGISGFELTGKNGNSIFIPVAGSRYYYDGSSISGTSGSYWASSRVADQPRYACYAYMYHNNNWINCSADEYSYKLRSYGMPVRAVKPGTNPVGHEPVDLGLSVMWASCNLGASSPEEFGDYFAWGEVESKSYYYWDNYEWYNGSVLTKYCTDPYSGLITFGKVDNKTVLDLEDDAAQVNWGGSWRMPTDAEFSELIDNCTWIWTEQNGVKGYLVTSNMSGYTGESIFLPAASHFINTNFEDGDVGYVGWYRSSSLDSSYPMSAYSLNITRGRYDNIVGDDRSFGSSIRPVLN